MPFSLRYSQLAIRISRAIVFIWFGLNKFIDPQHWIDALPRIVADSAALIHIGARDAVFFAGIFEILIAVSLATGFFIRWFASAALVFVLLAGVSHSFGEALIRDISVIGGL